MATVVTLVQAKGVPYIRTTFSLAYSCSQDDGL